MNETNGPLRLLSVQYAVTRLLVETDDPETIGDAILRTICDSLGWDVGEIWKPDGGGSFVRTNLYCNPAGEEKLTPLLRAAPRVGLGSLQSHVASLREALWHREIGEATHMARVAEARQAGIRSVFAIPIPFGDDLLGVMVLLSTETKPIGLEEKEGFLGLCNQIGLAMSRNQTAQALRRSEERLRRSHAAARIGTWDYDLRTGAVVWDGVELIHGLEPGSFGGSFNAYVRDVHAEDRGHVLHAIQAAAQYGTPLEVEYRIVLPDGSLRWVLGRGHTYQDASGRVVHMAGTCQDVTEQVLYRRAIEWLSASGAIFSQSVDRDSTLIQVADLSVPTFADACVVYMLEEDKAVRLHVASADERMAEIFSELDRRFQPDLSPKSQLTRAIEKGRPMLIGDFQEQWSSSAVDMAPEHRELVEALGIKSMILVPLMSRGQLAGLLSLMRCGASRPFDHREFAIAVEFGARSAHAMDNALLYEDLRSANRAKDEFLGIISHELRTPVTTIYGGARLLHSRWSSLDAESLDHLVQDLESESERLYRLIENLLVLGRLELGAEVPTQPVAVKPMVQKLLTTFSRRRANREVRVRVDDEVDVVEAEPTYLDQILYNLLTNADKYAPAEQPIDIEATLADDGFVFRVMDRGPGIPQEDRGRVFESFYRSKANPRGAPGKGVGLAVCKRLVEAMGGQIWIAEREGGGLEVGFALRPPEDESQSAPEGQRTGVG